MIGLEHPCRLWTGTLTANGYGRIYRDGRHWRAHRVAYEEAYGPIPPGITVDHLCFQPACIEPTHLRLLTRPANCARQRRAMADRCIRGHLYDEANTYRRTNGQRACRACHRDKQAAYKAADHEAHKRRARERYAAKRASA